MNNRATYLLFGAFALLLGVVCIMLYVVPEESLPQLLTSLHDKANPFSKSDIDRIEIETSQPASKLVFVRKGKSKDWNIVSPRSLLADSARVQSIIDALYDVAPEKEKQFPSFKEAELDNPKRTITLIQGGTDRKVSLMIGISVGFKEKTLFFVASSDAPKKVQAILKTKIEAALGDLNYYRSQDLLGSNTFDYQSVELQGGDKTLKLRKVADSWRFEQPNYGEAETASLLSNLAALRVRHQDEKDTDFVQNDVVEKDLAQFGLSAKDPTLRITVKRVDIERDSENKEKSRTDLTASLLVGLGDKAKKEIPVKDKSDKADMFDKGDKSDKGIRYYALFEGPEKSRDVVLLSSKEIDEIHQTLKDSSNLRNKALVKMSSFQQPDVITIERGGVKLDFRKPEPDKSWQLYRDGKIFETDKISMDILVGSLTRDKQVSSFPDSAKAKELNLAPNSKADIVVSVYVDSLDKDSQEASDKKEDSKDPKSTTKDKKKQDTTKETSKKDKEAKKSLQIPLKKDAKPVTVLRVGDVTGNEVAIERIWGEERTLVLVPESFRDQLRKSPLEYYDKTIPSYNPGAIDISENVTSLWLKRNGQEVQVRRAKAGEPWKFSDASPKSLLGQEANRNAVQDILRALSNINVTSIVTDAASKEQVSNFGLKSPPVVAWIELQKDKNSKPTSVTYYFGTEQSKNKGVYFQKTGMLDFIYVVNPQILADLRKDLRDPTIFTFAPEKVKSLKYSGYFANIGENLTRAFERKGESWVPVQPANWTLDQEKLGDFVRLLSDLRAEKILEGNPSVKPGIEIEITVEGEKTPYRLTIGTSGPDAITVEAATPQREFRFSLRRDQFEAIRDQPAYFSRQK